MRFGFRHRGTSPFSNGHGQIVGIAGVAQGGSRGFFYQRGRYRMIAGPAATFTRALDINAKSQIVGDYGTTPPAAARSVSELSRVPDTASLLATYGVI